MIDQEQQERSGYRALREADRLIADATAHIAGARQHMAELEGEGRNSAAIHETLEKLEAYVERVRRHKGILVRLLQKTRRRKAERRAAGTCSAPYVGAGGPKTGV